MSSDIFEKLKQIWKCLYLLAEELSGNVGGFFAHFSLVTDLYTFVARWIFPVLAIAIFLRCIFPLLQNRREKTVWGLLHMQDGTSVPLQHWENSIGRSRLADIVLGLPFVSRSHAVLTFRNGYWSITDLKSKNGVDVNGRRIEKAEILRDGDIISIGGMKMELVTDGERGGLLQQPTCGQSSRQERGGTCSPELSQKNNIVKAALDFGRPDSRLTFFLILLFQVLGALQLFFSMGAEVNPKLPLSFFLFILAECVHYSIANWLGWEHLELELLCYFLCGLSLSVTASAAPDSLFTQLGAIFLGFAAYTVLVVILRDLERAERLKYFLAAVALVLLALNLTMGETHYGAKRWLDLGLVTFQPSEFVKIAFVLVGTATLDKLLTTRNMSAFIGFSAVCIGSLVLMRDLGTVVVYFGTFIVIAFMRSGDLRTIALAATGAALGTAAAVSFLPYIASRFAVWGKVWEHAGTSGYQQTRTMIAAASGGLLGVGGGEGYLAGVAAADKDLVFGLLAEEWGLLVALTAVLIPVFLAFYAVFLTKGCRSSFYAIAACGAASIFLIQTALNVLGSVDIIPLTGITVPFVSRGGSSMVASWGLLALIKSADNRAGSGKRKRGRREVRSNN
ncbi:MAG: FtsW/RodA/SpoVE family cell cycle protein [Firmicutes bacterium]|nr:FtsW/RodA/SpoVE family cell cycle protein [Bacillota bacterium]